MYHQAIDPLYQKQTRFVLAGHGYGVEYQNSDRVTWRKKTDFFEKKDIAPNVPQHRPIEIFWALIEKQYTLKKMTERNFEKFRRVIEKIIIEVGETSGKALMRGPRQSLLSTGTEGVFGQVKD